MVLFMYLYICTFISGPVLVVIRYEERVQRNVLVVIRYEERVQKKVLAVIRYEERVQRKSGN